MGDAGYPISPDLVWSTLRTRCEGLFVLGQYYCPMSLFPRQYHLFRSNGQKAVVSMG